MNSNRLHLFLTSKALSQSLEPPTEHCAMARTTAKNSGAGQSLSKRWPNSSTLRSFSGPRGRYRCRSVVS